jgi:hypothetical protein
MGQLDIRLLAKLLGANPQALDLDQDVPELRT